MVQDLLIVVALLAHHGSTNLAQAYAMAPAGACEHEMLRNAFGVDGEAVDYKGLTIQMAGAEATTNLKLLANGEGALGANNFQARDASALATLYSHEVDDGAKV